MIQENTGVAKIFIAVSFLTIDFIFWAELLCYDIIELYYSVKNILDLNCNKMIYVELHSSVLS